MNTEELREIKRDDIIARILKIIIKNDRLAQLGNKAKLITYFV